MKKFIYRHAQKYHMNAAIRIMDEVLSNIPNSKKILVLINQDIKYLMSIEPGAYYVASERPLGVELVSSEVRHYFYLFKIKNKKKRIKTFIVPRIPNAIW